MPKTAPPFQKTADARSDLPAPDLPRLVESFLLAGDVSRHSERTIEPRWERLGRFCGNRQAVEAGEVQLPPHWNIFAAAPVEQNAGGGPAGITVF